MDGLIKRGRILGANDDVFSQNAWDDTEWTDEMHRDALQRIDQQRKEAKDLFGEDPHRLESVEMKVTQNWNDFYDLHEDKFFKDRKWIFSEFPEILEKLGPDNEACNLFEVGCGVGNAIAHIVEMNKNPNLHIYCCDLAPNAIKTLRDREFFKSNTNRVTPFTADICRSFDDQGTPFDQDFPIKSGSLDFVMMVFVLSAMSPKLMQDTIRNLSRLLKPGGLFLIRDYAQYDMTQLRFKGSSYLSDNYYVRHDGTTSFFFTEDTLDDIFQSAGCLDKIELKKDNRLLVNRLKSLKMCRCWVQAKYVKM